MVKPLWKTLRLFLKKLNISLLYDSAISLLNISPRDMQTYVQAKTRNLNVHHSQNQRQLKYLSTDEEVNKIRWSTMGYHPTVRKNEVLVHATMRMLC